MSDTLKMAKDLETTKVVVVGIKRGRYNDEPIVVYTNRFKGVDYFHIRTVYQDAHGKWQAGKGFSMPHTGSVKPLLKSLGDVSSQF